VLDGLRSALRRNPLTLALVESRPARAVARTTRSAMAVEQPGRFLARQLAGRPRLSAYRLRASGLTVHVRHGSRDLAIFREIFAANPWPNVYHPPPEVEAIVAARDAPRLVDLGGNIGLFGAYALGRWPGATVESFEPDPRNLPLMEKTIAANGLGSRWTAHPVAVSNRAGELPFVSGLHAESQLSGIGDPGARAGDAAPLAQGDEIVVAVVDLFEAVDGHVELLKIDVEGAEWAILADPRLAGLDAAAIVLEWHAMGAPEPNPRAAALRMLARAGFEGVHEGEQLGHTGMVWAWRPAPATRG
jgi:FkbM family methyltransferase